MGLENKKSQPEADAKAGLLNHLRKCGLLRGRAVISELAVDKWANRADIVTIGLNGTAAFEIKTSADRLTRLQAQVAAYRRVFDTVTAVVATKHVNTTLSVLPHDVGVMELVRFNTVVEVRELRPAAPSPVGDSRAAANLLPVAELMRLLRSTGFVGPVGKRRAEIMPLVDALEASAVFRHLRRFLMNRHGRSTRALLSAARGRSITPANLQLLRIWDQSPTVKEQQAAHSPGAEFEEWLARMRGPSAFGIVPDDIRGLFAAQSCQSSSVVSPPSAAP